MIEREEKDGVWDEKKKAFGIFTNKKPRTGDKYQNS